jgi:hypothetical protein
MSPATQRSYIHVVSKFSRYFGRSPNRLGLKDGRAFQVQRLTLTAILDLFTLPSALKTAT